MQPFSSYLEISVEWNTKCYLSDAMSENILLYMAKIWSCQYPNLIEIGQLKFVKQLLWLPTNTTIAYG